MKEMKEYEAEVRRRIDEKTDKIKRTRRTLGVILPLMLCRDGKTRRKRSSSSSSSSYSYSCDIPPDVPELLYRSEDIVKGTVMDGRIPDPEDGTVFTDRLVRIRVEEVFYGDLNPGDEVEIYIVNASHNAENDGIIPEDDDQICEPPCQLFRGQEAIFLLRYIEQSEWGYGFYCLVEYSDGLFASGDGEHYSTHYLLPDHDHLSFNLSDLPGLIEEAKNGKPKLNKGKNSSNTIMVSTGGKNEKISRDYSIDCFM